MNIIRGSINPFRIDVDTHSSVYLSDSDVDVSVQFHVMGKVGDNVVNIEKKDFVWVDAEGERTTAPTSSFVVLLPTEDLPVGTLHCLVTISLVDPLTEKPVRYVVDIDDTSYSIIDYV